MVISTQRSYENADETIILVRYLLSVAELILLEYAFAHELRADKIGRYVSVGIRLTAGYAFIKAMLVLFFGIV